MIFRSTAQKWLIADGSVGVEVGLSSRDIHATAAFSPLGPVQYRRLRV
jgi:hypothetical protein